MQVETLELPPTNEDPKNPMLWDLPKVIEATVKWNQPIRETSTSDEITSARKSLWALYMVERGRIKKKAHRLVCEKARELYETGTPMPLLLGSCRVKESQIYKWAELYKWKRPTVPTASEEMKANPAKLRKTLRDLAKADDQLEAIKTAEAAGLTSMMQEIQKQGVMLAVNETLVEKIPIKDWSLMFRLRIGRLALRITQKLERMDDDELIDPQTVKTLKSLSEITEKVSPPEQQEQTRRGSLLNEHVLMGVVQFPVQKQPQEKLADAKEVSD